MNQMDLIDRISELKITITSLKAVISSFATLYTEGTEDKNLLAVKTSPEQYVYLYHVITEVASKAAKDANELEAAAERYFENSKN